MDYNYKFENLEELIKEGFVFSGFALGNLVEGNCIYLKHNFADRYKAYQIISTLEGNYKIDLKEVVKL